MSPLLDEEKPPRPPATFVSRLRDPDSRSIEIGLIATLLIHLVLFLLAPRVFRFKALPASAHHPLAANRQFNIQIVPEETAAKKPPLKFVETNPNAPENKPDHTNNFGAQNQQAAQPKPDLSSKLDLPKTEGQTKIKSDSIVTGRLQKVEPRIAPPPRPEQKPTEAQLQHPRKEQIPLPGFEKTTGTDANGFGENLFKPQDNAQPVPDQVAGVKEAQDAAGASVKSFEQTQPTPLPRPRLQYARPTILQERPMGVSQTGVIGVDANFSQFGDYLQQLIDAVQLQWDNLNNISATHPPPGSNVDVAFRLTSQGKVEILNVDGSADKQGRLMAVSSITLNAPYKAWTKEMVNVLGDDQVITFHFYWY